MDPLAAHDIAQITADNPSAYTLAGTNTWLVGREPCWVVDPGPDLESHRARVLSDARDRGGIGGIAITHHPPDHTDGVAKLPQAARGPPGRAPLVLDAAAKLDEYVAHRLDRERRLEAALADGLRTADELLGRVWSDAPSALRGAATVTLAAHLDKLAEEGRLPDDVERPQLSGYGQV